MNEEQLAVLPEKVRDWDEAKNSDTPEVFWDRISNIRSKLGTRLYQPGEDAGQEDWDKFSSKATDLSNGRLMPKPDFENAEANDAFYTSLGRPEDDKGYEFTDMEGMNLSDERKEFLSKLAFKANITKAQLKVLDDGIRTADLQANEAATEAFGESMKELKQEWGMATDERTHDAKKVAEIFFPHLGKDAVLSAAEIKAFYSISKQLGKESSEFKKQGDQSSNAISPDEAVNKISEIRNNNDHPYNNPHDSGHEAAKKQMRKLYLAKNNLPPE